jgi:hypothetical protein
MVRYFYSLTPLFIVGTLFILALPWLGLIALMIVTLAALPALVWAIVFVPYTVGRAISRRWQLASGAFPRPTAALSPATPQPALRKGHAS